MKKLWQPQLIRWRTNMRLALSIICTLAFTSLIANTKFLVHSTKDQTKIGTVTCNDSHYGLLCHVTLTLPQGPHGLHIHSGNSCAESGMAAKGHLSLRQQSHLGPYNSMGHLGDLPVILSNHKQIVDTLILAPRLTESLLKAHSIIVHANGDNYSDTPNPLGGGGPRIACGLIVK